MKVLTGFYLVACPGLVSKVFGRAERLTLDEKSCSVDAAVQHGGLHAVQTDVKHDGLDDPATLFLFGGTEEQPARRLE